MKKLLPLMAASALAAACNMADNDHYNNPTGMHTGVHNAQVVAPAPYMTQTPVVATTTTVPTTVVAPAGTAVVRADGTYVMQPNGTYVAVPMATTAEVGYQHKHADDSLSERSLGSTRGSHNQPMTHKDADHDGNYDFQPYYSPYVPYYSPRARGWYYVQ